MRKATGQQGGFTLIEMAIVLVIIGLIIGAVLKGQDLIQNARAKKFVNFVRAAEIAQWTHLDRKGAFNNSTNGLITSHDSDWPGFQNPPEDKLTIGSYSYTLYYNSNSRAKKNFISVKPTAGGAFTAEELLFLESLDTAIDGTVNATSGRVRGIRESVNSHGPQASLTNAADNYSTAQTIIYYFDRK